MRLQQPPSGTTGNVQHIPASGGAIAALLDNGFAATWGNSVCGNDSSGPLRDSGAMCRTPIHHHSCRALAALLSCKSALGHGYNQILEVVSCTAQLALLGDGFAATRGNFACGNDSSAPQGPLRNVQHIRAALLGGESALGRVYNLILEVVSTCINGSLAMLSTRD